jgi:hypothetical protein
MDHMKKTILICFYCLSVVIANAQNGKYIPFPSKMIILGYTEKVAAAPNEYQMYRLEIGGDTTINAVHYSKQYAEKTAIAGIRNDIPNKKVYRYLFSTKAEELLYDFDLRVGDTVFKNKGFGFFPDLYVSQPYAKIDTAWVFRIDSVLMPHDNLYHKRFNFMAKVKPLMHPSILANTDQQTIIGTGYDAIAFKIEPLVEGVGEFYNTFSQFGVFELYWKLRYICISIDHKTVVADPGPGMTYPHDPALCSSILVSVPEENSWTHLILYPNPSNGKLELVTNPSINNYFEINDVLGRKIYVSKIENETTEIDLHSEQPGIYFIHIYNTTGNSQTKKILIN